MAELLLPRLPLRMAFSHVNWRGKLSEPARNLRWFTFDGDTCWLTRSAKGHVAPKHNYKAPHARHQATAAEAADGFALALDLCISFVRLFSFNPRRAAFSHARHSDDQAIGGAAASPSPAAADGVQSRELAWEAQ